MVQTSAWMQLNHLIVFHGQIVASSFEMCCLFFLLMFNSLLNPIQYMMFYSLIYLHKESWHKCLAYIQIVVAAGKLSACSLQIESVHDSRQLRADIVGAFEWTKVDKIVVAPLRILMVCANFKRETEKRVAILCFRYNSSGGTVYFAWTRGIHWAWSSGRRLYGQSPFWPRQLPSSPQQVSQKFAAL